VSLVPEISNGAVSVTSPIISRPHAETGAPRANGSRHRSSVPGTVPPFVGGRLPLAAARRPARLRRLDRLRRVVLPNQDDLTNDLVARSTAARHGKRSCLELGSGSTGRRADAATDVSGPACGRSRADRTAWPCPASAASSSTLQARVHATLSLHSAIIPGCRLEAEVLRATWRREAAATVAGVATGDISPWVLGWLPLMRGGGDPV